MRMRFAKSIKDTRGRSVIKSIRVEETADRAKSIAKMFEGVGGIGHYDTKRERNEETSETR